MRTKNRIKLFMTIGYVIAACGNEVTGTSDWDHTCDQAKLDFLHQHFGATYTPTDEVMQQSQFNLGGSSKAVFTIVNGQCTVTVT